MKVLFLDIDGTLVDLEGKIPDSAVRAIRAAREKGNRVYLTSGRSKAEIYESLWAIGFDGLLGGNGMYIEDGGEVLQDLAMTAEDTALAVDWLEEKDLGFYLESKNGLFANSRLISRAASFYGVEESTVRSWFPEMIYNEDLRRGDVAKISFILEPDLLDDARRAFGERLKVDSWSVSGKRPEFGELAILGADKVHAVAHLLEHLGVSVEDTIAFGDAENDLQMIRYCHTGVAMGNAADCLKEAADYTTDRVDRDGLYKAFEALHLIS